MHQHSLTASRGVSGAWLLVVRRARRATGKAARAAAAASSARGLVAAGAVVGSAAAGGGLNNNNNSGSSSNSNSSGPPANNKKTKGPLDFGSPLRRATDVLLAANAAAFALQWLSRDALTVWGAKVNSLIAAGQVWRLFTPAFLHTSLIHLAINAHALHTIGPHLELVGGRARFAAVYAAGAVAGAVASFIATPAPSVGASAALFGLGAGLAVFYARHRLLVGEERSDFVLRQLGLALAINVGYSLANRRIDNWGHLGGMAGGALAAWALGPRVARDPKTGRLVDAPPVPWLARGGGATGGGGGGGPVVAMVAAYSGASGSRGRGGKQPPRKQKKAADEDRGTAAGGSKGGKK